MAAETAGNASSKPKSSGLRQLILIGILIVCGGALLYDRQVARPAAEAAHTLIEEKALENVRSNARPLSDKDIQSILNRKPSKVEDLEFRVVETYSWMGGVPWRSYYVTVVYAKTRTDLAFTAHYLNEAAPDESTRDRFDDGAGDSEEPQATMEEGDADGAAPSGGGMRMTPMEAPENPARQGDPSAVIETLPEGESTAPVDPSTLPETPAATDPAPATTEDPKA